MVSRPELRVVAIVFLLAVGLTMTGLGASNFHEATASIAPEKVSPYSIAGFSSPKMHFVSFQIYVHPTREMEWGKASLMISFHFFIDEPLQEGEAQLEQSTLGFQIPYKAERIDGKPLFFLGTWMDGNWVNVNITEENIIIFGDTASIVYCKFGPLNKAFQMARFEGELFVEWKDFLPRKSFSTYEMVLSFGLAYFAQSKLSWEVQLIGYDNVFITVYIPEGTALRDVFPTPDGETWTSMGFYPEGESKESHIYWFNDPIRVVYWNLSYHIRGAPWGTEQTGSFRITFDRLEELELRNRLFFNSGLFMGVGIQFIITGVYEALRYRAEKAPPPPPPS